MLETENGSFLQGEKVDLQGAFADNLEYKG